MTDYENIIRQYVHLPSRPTGRGWYSLKCQICHDYKVRAGFMFENGNILYSCFNCAHKARFNPENNNVIPEPMKTVFDAYLIPTSEFQKAMFDGFVKRSTEAATKEAEEDKRLKITYNKLRMPSFFRPLETEGGDVYDELACDYLRNERQIDPSSYKFLIADKEECSGELWKKWKGRVIIPYYRNDDLIFYQGRDVMNTDRTKYLSPSDSREAVLYGFDELYTNSDKPLYVHEGFFDAFTIKNSVAVMNNVLSEQQVAILNRCPREKVVIPDRQGKGYLMAERALKEGWSVSFPDIGSDSKDMNDAVKKYGRLYVLRSIADNTVSGLTAALKIKMHCKE